MSVRITLHCDRTHRYGVCTGQLVTDAHTREEARAAASRLGWRHHPDTDTDHCPAHTGRNIQPGTTITHLHPETTP